MTQLGVVPSIVRAWRSSDCMAALRWPRLRCFASTGEASSPEDYAWLMALELYRAPVIEYCGGVRPASRSVLVQLRSDHAETSGSCCAHSPDVHRSVCWQDDCRSTAHVSDGSIGRYAWLTDNCRTE